MNDLQTLCHPLTNFERFTLPPRTGRFINTLPCQNCIYLPNSNFQRNIIEVLPKVLYIMAEGKSRGRMCVSNCGCKCQFHLIFNEQANSWPLALGGRGLGAGPQSENPLRSSPILFHHYFGGRLPLPQYTTCSCPLTTIKKSVNCLDNWS